MKNFGVFSDFLKGTETFIARPILLFLWEQKRKKRRKGFSSLSVVF
jgi:hypothetical protein